MKLNSVQVLRGFAASTVMLYHIDKTVFPYGWAGVDLFFIVSGFVMAKVESGQTPCRFFIKRLIRIVPLYWLVTMAMFTFVNHLHLFGGRPYTMFDLLKSLFFIPYTAPNGEVWPIVIPGWTLNFEMFFYAIFTMALFVSGTLWMALAAITTAVLAGLVLRPHDPILSTWTSPMLLEFGMGCLVAHFHGARSHAHRPRFEGFLVPAAFVYLAIMLEASGLDPSTPWGRVAVFGVASLLLFVGCLLMEERWSRFFSARPLVFLGDISYSLYLLHSFAFALVFKFMGVSVGSSFAAVVIAIGIAYASYVVVETYLAKKLRSMLIEGRGAGHA